MKSKIPSIFIVALVALFGYGCANAADDDFDKLMKLAEQGDVDVQVNLGFMYGKGLGVPQDLAMACAWFNVAAASGNENAKEARDMILKVMTP